MSRTNFLWIAVLVEAFVIILLTNRNKPQIEGNRTQTDTLVVYEVKEVYKPVICEKRVVDTIRVRDTVFVKESVAYQDSSVRVVASGIGVSIDSVSYRLPTRTIYVREPFKQHSLELKAEAWYLGTLATPIELGYSYRPKKWVEFGGDVGYDPISKTPFIKARAGVKLNW